MDENIRKQLAEMLEAKVEWVQGVKINEDDHTVDFLFGSEYWAKLTKNNKRVRKNSIRLAGY